MRFFVPTVLLCLIGAQALPHELPVDPTCGSGVGVPSLPEGGLPNLPGTPGLPNLPGTPGLPVDPEDPTSNLPLDPEEPEHDEPEHDEPEYPSEGDHDGSDNNNTCSTGELTCCTGDALISLSCLLPGLLAPACGQQVCCINNGSGDQTCTTTSGLNINVPITFGDIDIL